jgi:hypothetical protein
MEMDIMKKIGLAAIAVSSALINGCGSTPQTPEEKAIAMEMQRAFISKLNGMNVQNIFNSIFA